jgi:hypothetical protein
METSGVDVEAAAQLLASTWDLAGAPEPLFAATYFLGGQGLEQPLVFQPRRKLDHCIASGEATAVFDLWDPPGFAVELPRQPGPERPPLPEVPDEVVDEIRWRAFEVLSARWGIVVVGDDGDRWTNPDRVRAVAACLSAAYGEQELARWVAEGWLMDPEDLPAPLEGLRGGFVVLRAVKLQDGRRAGLVRHWSGGIPEFREEVTDLETEVLLQKRPTMAETTPAVVAGYLPHGATAAHIQDLRDEWHEAEVIEGAYLAILPHGPRGGPPPARFFDAQGGDVDLEPPTRRGWQQTSWTDEQGRPIEPPSHEERLRRQLEQLEVEPVWAAELQPDPRPTAVWGSNEVLLQAGGDRVWTERTDEVPDGDTNSRDALEGIAAASLGDREGGRAALDAEALSELEASHAGQSIRTLSAVRSQGFWAATLYDDAGRLLMTACGKGPAPRRLTFETHQPSR